MERHSLKLLPLQDTLHHIRLHVIFTLGMHTASITTQTRKFHRRQMLQFKGEQCVDKCTSIFLFTDFSTGRSGMRQYMHAQQTHKVGGIKLWVLATSDLSSPDGTGYVADFDVSLGSQAGSGESLTQRVVIELLVNPPNSKLPILKLGQGYHLFNLYFVSIHMYKPLFMVGFALQANCLTSSGT